MWTTRLLCLKGLYGTSTLSSARLPWPHIEKYKCFLDSFNVYGISIEHTMNLRYFAISTVLAITVRYIYYVLNLFTYCKPTTLHVIQVYENYVQHDNVALYRIIQIIHPYFYMSIRIFPGRITAIRSFVTSDLIKRVGINVGVNVFTTVNITFREINSIQ